MLKNLNLIKTLELQPGSSRVFSNSQYQKINNNNNFTKKSPEEEDFLWRQADRKKS